MKILVVDDSQLNLNIALEYLEEFPGVTEIFLCKEPEKVKSIIDKHGIDILILDIIMPVISGLDLLIMLRDDGKYDDMPIIMLTSLDDTESYVKCFEYGAFDYINKPINGMEFNVRLKVAMEATNKSKSLKSLIQVTQIQNDALKVINAQLTEAKFQLVQSEKMAAVGQLAAGLAHEINNPMSYVNSNFEIMQKYFLQLTDFLHFYQESLGNPSITDNEVINKSVTEVQNKFKTLKIDNILEDMEDILSDSENGIQRVTNIVRSLRTFTRSVKDDEKTTYPLMDLIRQVVLISRNEIKYFANVKLDIPEDIIIYCNGVQIAQVFVNILVNAAQAIKSQKKDKMGLIKISARIVKQEVIIRFEDDGPGIPEENLLKIFEPFFTTKDIGQGTGLGLSISYDIIVNKHRGSIDVKSELGKGCLFTVKLPLLL